MSSLNHHDFVFWSVMEADSVGEEVEGLEEKDVRAGVSKSTQCDFPGYHIRSRLEKDFAYRLECVRGGAVTAV